LDRGRLRPAREPGRRDRLRRMHRALLRPAPPLRGPHQRRTGRPSGLSLTAQPRDVYEIPAVCRSRNALRQMITAAINDAAIVVIRRFTSGPITLRFAVKMTSG